MIKRAFAHAQHILPQHLLTALIGRIAECQTPWLKNFLINQFIKLYNIDIHEAASADLQAYPTFNSFFIRHLKPGLRSVANGPHDIASPADGTLAQFGCIKQNQLLQAKGSYFDLETLLGGDNALATTFYDGDYATIYLAPNNYHRFHMPIAGKLEKTIYVPGKLFSVNRITSEVIPHLYSRNERLITVFNTAAGSMAVILVGAMIVGSIQTVWMDKPIRSNQILTDRVTDNIDLAKGAELGYFKMGSTVILLFSKNKMKWAPNLAIDSPLTFGQLMGETCQ